MSDGSIAQEITYNEFGKVLSDTNPGSRPFGFAGGIYDAQTSLTKFGVRDYDAEVGRWLTKDPILLAGGVLIIGGCMLAVTDAFELHWKSFNNQFHIYWKILLSARSS